MLTTVPLAKIIRDDKVQARVALNNVTINDLTDAYENNEEVPPPVLFTADEQLYYVGDGFHRLCALTNLEVEEWPFDVRKGNKEDAFVFNCLTNGGLRGLPMTNKDKRKAARLAIDLWGSTLSDREIAEKIALSHALISNVRQEMGGVSPSPKSRVSTVDTNLVTTPTLNPTLEPPPFVDSENLDEWESVSQSGNMEVAVMDSPEMLKGGKAAKAMLDELRLGLGRCVRMADEANQSRKYAGQHKTVLLLLNKTLEEVNKWKGQT